MKNLLKNIKISPVRLALYVIAAYILFHPLGFYYALTHNELHNLSILHFCLPLLFYYLLSLWANNIGASAGAGLVLLTRWSFEKIFLGMSVFNPIFTSSATMILNLLLFAEGSPSTGVLMILDAVLMSLGAFAGWLVWRKVGHILPVSEEVRQVEPLPATHGPARLTKRVIRCGLVIPLLIGVVLAGIPGGLVLCAASIVPLGICGILNRRLADKWIGLFGALAVILMNLYVLIAMLLSHSSTAGLELLVLPIYLMLALVAGLLLGWLVSIMIRLVRFLDPYVKLIF